MNLFSSIATAAALTVAPLTALEASAGVRTGHIQGYIVEVVESSSRRAPDFITVYGPRGIEQITVACAPFNWSSYGANTEAFANAIAYDWCF